MIALSRQNVCQVFPDRTVGGRISTITGMQTFNFVPPKKSTEPGPTEEEPAIRQPCSGVSLSIKSRHAEFHQSGGGFGYPAGHRKGGGGSKCRGGTLQSGGPDLRSR